MNCIFLRVGTSWQVNQGQDQTRGDCSFGLSFTASFRVAEDIGILSTILLYLFETVDYSNFLVRENHTFFSEL